MMQDILISVIIPNYNGEKYLRRSVNSLINQSKPVYEIIIVDDCSTDHSQEIMLELKRKYPIIKNIFSEHNTGVSGARNTGIEAAKGDYITFLDVDDIFPSDAVECYQRAIMQYANKAIYQGLQSGPNSEEVYLMDSYYLRKLCLGYPRSRNYELDVPTCVKESVHGCYGKLYNRRFLERNRVVFREGIGLGEDLLFYYEALCHTSQVCILESVVYRIIYEQGSATRSFNPQMPGYALKFANEIWDLEIDLSLQNDVAYQINQHVNKAIGCYYFNSESKGLFKKSRELKCFLSEKVIYQAYSNLVASSIGIRRIKYLIFKHKLSFLYLLILHIGKYLKRISKSGRVN